MKQNENNTQSLTSSNLVFMCVIDRMCEKESVREEKFFLFDILCSNIAPTTEKRIPHCYQIYISLVSQ